MKKFDVGAKTKVIDKIGDRYLITISLMIESDEDINIGDTVAFRGKDCYISHRNFFTNENIDQEKEKEL